MQEDLLEIYIIEKWLSNSWFETYLIWFDINIMWEKLDYVLWPW